jgi:uncharacterized membrane protein
MMNIDLTIILWCLAGMALALIFAFLQQLAIRHATNADSQNFFYKSIWQSVIRIVICVVLIFISVSKSITYGLVFIAAYLLTRWISLYFLTKKL